MGGVLHEAAHLVLGDLLVPERGLDVREHGIEGAGEPPTSVSGAALSTRWLRSPAAILAAVRSTRFRVRNARWTARLATITVPAVASRPMVTTIEVTRSTEEVTLCRGRATAMVPSPLLSPYSCTRQPLESGCVPGTSKEAEPRSRASAGVMSGRAGSSAPGITGVWTTRAPSLSHTTP